MDVPCIPRRAEQWGIVQLLFGLEIICWGAEREKGRQLKSCGAWRDKRGSNRKGKAQDRRRLGCQAHGTWAAARNPWLLKGTSVRIVRAGQMDNHEVKTHYFCCYVFVFENAQWTIFLGPKSEQNPTKSIAERGCGGGCQTPEVGRKRQETTSSISRLATHGVGGQPGTDIGDPVSNQCKVKKKREV